LTSLLPIATCSGHGPRRDGALDDNDRPAAAAAAAADWCVHFAISTTTTITTIIITIAATTRSEHRPTVVCGDEPLKTRGALSLSTMAAARDNRPSAHLSRVRASARVRPAAAKVDDAGRSLPVLRTARRRLYDNSNDIIDVVVRPAILRRTAAAACRLWSEQTRPLPGQRLFALPTATALGCLQYFKYYYYTIITYLLFITIVNNYIDN